MKLSYPEIRKRCLKPDEAQKPLYARVVTHALSTRLIWALQEAPFTANQITLFSLLIAFAALPFFFSLSGVSVLLGAFVIELYYVLDAVDGQWARLKNQRSLTGTFFDYLINYALHPPLFLAIGWGVYQATLDASYLVLAFTGGFASLWVVLIWNLRASVLLSVLKRKQSTSTFGDKMSSSKSFIEDQPVDPRLRGDDHFAILRNLFGWLHKLLVFPWFMHVLSLTALAAFTAETLLGVEAAASEFFGHFLSFYGWTGPFVAVALTAQWILTRKLEKAPELQP